jgi:polysaccharide export outer membrane protein
MKGVFMRLTLVICLLVAAATAQQPNPNPNRAIAIPEAGANLPTQSIGPNDLIAVTVYNTPELSRTIRVGADGYIRLPMLKQRIKADGLYPSDLETAIAEALRQEEYLVNPFVTVTIAEYHSRPITVSGAVKLPLEFQAASPTTLLEAISKAGGLSDSAGPEILVSQTQPGPDGTPVSHIRHIPVRGLINDADADLNFKLTGGEQVLVPEAAKIYVLGYVKMPNTYKVQDGSEISIMQILALSQGLAPYAAKVAYIYRPDGAGGRTEISVPLAKILNRKAPDVSLLANDIFYVPDNTGKRIALTTLDKLAPLGGAVGAAMIYTH